MTPESELNETFTLKAEKVDFDNLLITVIGKGNRERIIPFSQECRKVLWKYQSLRPRSDLFFCTRDGGKLMYDNIRRDFNTMLKKAGVERTEGSFHALRRKFAGAYVKNGGNVLYLMKMMGHTSLTMVRRYVEANTEELSAMHVKTSLMTKLRG